MSGKLELGQVVYVTVDTKQRILPGLLVEELVMRTIDGSRTTYVVQIGHEQKTKFEEEKVFPSLKSAREVMLKRFASALEKLLDNAEILAKDWYGDKVKNEPEPPQQVKKATRRPPPPPKPEDDDLALPADQNAPIANVSNVVQVRMADGTIANVKIPDGVF